MRLAISASVSTQRQSADPYHSRSEELVWDLLTRLDAIGFESFKRQFDIGIDSDTTGLIERRVELLGPSLSLSYRDPIHIVHGRGSYLFDQTARRFLDCVNNVAHVGHGHPRVVEAAGRQMERLNTNTRYLHEEVLRYAERLRSRFDPDLDTVFLVNSGSEANELAIRLARAATGRFDIACLEHGYHGNTSTLVDVSHYKFAGPGGIGQRDWVSVIPCPDPYRRPEYSGPGGVEAYAGAVRRALSDATSALIAESLPGVAGQIRPEKQVMRGLYREVHSSGALVIADEVQAGFGRVGESFWSFGLFDVSPDIVTMGKPIGNGHPLGAVVTNRAIAEAFDNGMEYFNTFGGNPVSAAVGNAVLDVIDDEGLQERAGLVGRHLKEGLTDLAGSFELIGDVRGEGLFLGVELVADRGSREPAPIAASRVVEGCRDRGVLLSTDGPHKNVIKIKPPMVFGEREVRRLLEALEASLAKV